MSFFILTPTIRRPPCHRPAQPSVYRMLTREEAEEIGEEIGRILCDYLVYFIFFLYGVCFIV